MLKIWEVPESSKARQDVYRLRYEVFVVEERFCQKYADPVEGTICEPLDESGHVYAAYAEDDLVGTVRSNYAFESDLHEYFELYGVNSADFQDASVTSKLIVARNCRSSTLAFRLAAATYADGLAVGIRFNLIDCHRALVPFYERLGYRAHGSVRYRFPEVGEGVVMILHVQDEAYLRRVGSPFLKLYRTWKEGALAR
jgi:predicted GNAT family N-acyltransferase